MVCVCARGHMVSCVQPFVTPWTVAHQALLFMDFSRQEYWSGLPFPSSGDLPDPLGMKTWDWTHVSCVSALWETQRIHLLMQETWVGSLVLEDPTCLKAAKTVCHNYWACVILISSVHCPKHRNDPNIPKHSPMILANMNDRRFFANHSFSFASFLLICNHMQS